jgi:protein-S-isoprenylcysteine O-methyltransferase Ste14
MSLISVAENSQATLMAQFRAFQRTKAYDLLAASPIVAWFGFCAYHQIPALIAQLGQLRDGAPDFLFIASLSAKFASVIFILVLGTMLVVRHTPLAKCSGIFPRIAAVAGTYLGVSMVLQHPTELPAALHLVSVLLILGGTIFSLYSVSQLGRSISMLPEARRLVTSGPYAMIRHPLYLGEAVALAGLTLQYFSAWSLLILIIQTVFQLERMTNEERVLASAFPGYSAYMERTARVIPGIY